MRKKIIISYFLIASLLILVSCYQPHGIRSSGREDLYAVACYSVPFIKGSWDWDRAKEIEKDSFGRVLYKYYSHSSAISGIKGDYICALIIYQQADNQYVYYYEDFSFIISTDQDNFSEDKISSLKSQNDWEREINSSKMTKVAKSFGPYDDYVTYDDQFSNNLTDYLDNSTSQEYLIDLVAMDENMKYFFAVREYEIVNNKFVFDDSFFVFTNEKFEIESEQSIIEIDDFINCQDEMHQFKEQNDWSFSNYLAKRY